MTKRIATRLFVALLLVSLFTACSQKETDEAANGATGTYADYIDSGKVFAAQIGDVYGVVANDIFKAAKVQEFTLAPDMLEAVRLGKVDAAILDDAYVKQIQDSEQYPDLDYLPVPKEVFVNMASNVFHTVELRDKFNEWFETILEDGTFDEIYGRWIGVSLPEEKDIPRFELTGENGTLKVCNTGNFPPFSYVDSNNQPVGFDEEILSRFAEHLGMDIEYNMMAYDAVIPYVLSGKADMSGCSFTVTDERSDGVIFGAAYTKARAVLVIKKDDAAAMYDYTAFAGKRIGAQTGEIYVLVAQDILMAGEVPEYPTITDLLESLKMGRTDAVITDSSYIEPLIDSDAYPEFDYVWIPKDVYSNESAVVLHTEELRGAFNEWLADIISDGTMAEMEERWLGVSLPNEEDIPKFTLTGENGVLRVCDTGDYPPFSYFDSNGDYCGMDYELISRFAQHMGMTLDVTMMSYAAIAPYVASGKADMSACYLTISEERGQSMIFSDPVVSTQGVLIVPKAGAKAGIAAPRDYTAFSGSDIAVITGVLTYNTTEVIGGNPIEYNDSASAAEDVRLGRVAGYMHALTAVQVMASQMDGFEAIPVPKDIFSAQVGAMAHDQETVDSFNTFLAATRADGTLTEMQSRWFGEGVDLDAPMPEIKNSGENGTLVIAICSDAIPYVFSVSNSEYSGYSVELALRFGAYEGKIVKFTDMDFGGLIPYIVSEKADLAIANVAITEERKKSVLFTEPFFDEQHGILALAAEEEKATGFTAWLKTGIERNLIIDNRWKMIVSGLGVTMIIAVLAQIFGTAFGAFVCWLLTWKNRFVRLIGNLYCGLIYGTPIVVLLMITYYIIFGNTSISNVLVAVCAFTMITGASVAANLKGAIETVDTVEIEAARSIGFTAFKAFRTVTLPQAIRRALPGYTNGFVELVKATAIVGYIAIQDLTRAGDIIRSRTYDAYFPLLFVAVIYLIVTTICVQVFKAIVKRVNKGD